ncbi:hypothetical protein HDU80_000260 [Chytriomyces hyalinus]|nr:hypothetical protein HDU80_000260 [Chytriomyces hyalinus]
MKQLQLPVPISDSAEGTAANIPDDFLLDAKSDRMNSFLERCSEDLRQFHSSKQKGSAAGVKSDATLPALPAGYSLTLVPRGSGDGKQGDLYVLGHPSGKRFRSAKSFIPHLLYLAGGMTELFTVHSTAVLLVAEVGNRRKSGQDLSALNESSESAVSKTRQRSRTSEIAMSKGTSAPNASSEKATRSKSKDANNAKEQNNTAPHDISDKKIPMARKSVRASISKADEIHKHEAPVSKAPSKAEASEVEKNDAQRSSRGSRKSGGIPAAFEIDLPTATAAAAAEQDKRGRNGKRASETRVESEAPKKKRAASVKISPEEASVAEKHSTGSPVAATVEPALTVHAVTEIIQDALKNEKQAWASEVASNILEGSLLSSKVKEMIEGQLDDRIEKMVKMHVESIIKDCIKKELELQLVSMKTEMKDAIREIAENEALQRTDVPNAEAEFVADVEMSAAEPVPSVPENDDSVPETPAEEIPEGGEPQQEEAENTETQLDQGTNKQDGEEEQNDKSEEKTSTDAVQNEGESTPEAAGVTSMEISPQQIQKPALARGTSFKHEDYFFKPTLHAYDLCWIRVFAITSEPYFGGNKLGRPIYWPCVVGRVLKEYSRLSSTTNAEQSPIDGDVIRAFRGNALWVNERDDASVRITCEDDGQYVKVKPSDAARTVALYEIELLGLVDACDILVEGQMLEAYQQLKVMDPFPKDYSFVIPSVRESLIVKYMRGL